MKEDINSLVGTCFLENFWGDNTLTTLKEAVGEGVQSIRLMEERLIFKMKDTPDFCIEDQGQSCCEHRYLTTDDDLTQFDNSILYDLEIASGNSEGILHDDYLVHEVMFLKVKTSKGVFTVETHNVHNGYYGGFDVEAFNC